MAAIPPPRRLTPAARVALWLACTAAGCSSVVARTGAAADEHDGGLARDDRDDVEGSPDAEATIDRPLPIDRDATVGCVPPDASLAGGRCEGDRDCDPCGTTGMICQRALRGGGFCTHPCRSDWPQAEEVACGAGATCVARSPLTTSDPLQGFCLHACAPHEPWDGETSCPGGEVCTAFWFGGISALREVAGCFPFCREDSDCAGTPGAPRCNTRLGRCAAAPFDARRLPDGAPCDPVDVRPTCRGACLAEVQTFPRQGLCSSYVNLDQTKACPDAAQTLTRYGTDRLGLCRWRDCVRHDDCPAGLICRSPEINVNGALHVVTETRHCDYPTERQPGR